MTIPQYPDNYNSLISLSIQKELEQKSPKDYLKYVNENLSIDERESLMIDEYHRRKTFLTDWTHDGNLVAECIYYLFWILVAECIHYLFWILVFWVLVAECIYYLFWVLVAECIYYFFATSIQKK